MIKIIETATENDIDNEIVSMLEGEIKEVFNFTLESIPSIKVIKVVNKYGMLYPLSKSINISRINKDNTNIMITKGSKSIKPYYEDIKLDAKEIYDIGETPIETSILSYNRTKGLSEYDNRINVLYPTCEFSLGNIKRDYKLI